MFPRRYLQLGRCRIAYLDEGRGEPILFIHGIPTSSHLWRKVIDGLRGEFRCIAPDLLGLGHSEGPLDEDYSMPAHARRLVALLDGLEIEQATVVAHDQGGAAGQLLAVRHRERVRRLILVNCVCYDNWPVPEIRALMAVARLGRLTRMLERTPLFGLLAHSRFGLRLGVHDPGELSRETVREYVAPLMASAETRARFKRFLLAGDSRHTMEAARGLAGFDRPALVVWAEQDRFLPVRWAERLASDLPDSRLVRIAGAGHFVQEERPAELARAIAGFMRS